MTKSKQLRIYKYLICIENKELTQKDFNFILDAIGHVKATKTVGLYEIKEVEDNGKRTTHS